MMLRVIFDIPRVGEPSDCVEPNTTAFVFPKVGSRQQTPLPTHRQYPCTWGKTVMTGTPAHTLQEWCTDLQNVDSCEL